MPSLSEQASSLKRRINEGKTVVGVSVPLDADRDRMRAILDHGPYDYVATDSQHGAFNEERLVSFCETAAELDMPTQFRIKHTRHAYMIGNILDLGPTGIEVPQVELESTVDEALASFYYPQTGLRSWGGAKRLGLEPETDRREYSRWWGQTGVLWMQIESIASATAARKLAKPGVDCLSFGPVDLTFNLEAHPDHPFKTVDDCVRHVAEQLRDSDVAVCYRIATPDTRQKYFDMGVTVLLEQAQA